MKSIATEPKKSVLAFYDTHEQAENAVIRLEQKGFAFKQFSIIAIDLYTSEKVLGYYNTLDRMKNWALTGGFYSGFWGLLFGFSTYSLPIIGPSLIQGWVGAILTGLALAVSGAVVSAFAALLYHFLPTAKKIKYQTDVKAGKYMLLTEGDDANLDTAREILRLHIPKQKYNAKNWRESYSQLQSK